MKLHSNNNIQKRMKNSPFEGNDKSSNKEVAEVEADDDYYYD